MQLSPQAEVWASCESICLAANALTLSLLADEKPAAAWPLLEAAVQICHPESAAAAVTANALGCYHRHVGELDRALQYLHGAAAIDARCANPRQPAITHLNLGATYGSLGMHAEAVDHSKRALETLAVDRATLSTVTAAIVRASGACRARSPRAPAPPPPCHPPRRCARSPCLVPPSQTHCPPRAPS